MPKVSVIVPVYKVEPYLRRCIESILSQSFSDYELILVDDGSPDNCGAICDAYANTDERVRVIHKQNGGLSDARNAGLKVATGDYVLFVDSDDYIESDLLEAVSPYLQEAYPLIHFGYVSEDEQGCELFQYAGYIDEKRFDNKNDAVKFICNELIDYKIAWNAWCSIFDRRMIEKYNLRFEDNKRIFAEDLCFFLCYCAQIDRFVCIRQPLYHYVKRTESIMETDSGKINMGRFEQLAKTVYEYYRSNDDLEQFVELFPAIYYRIMRHAIYYDTKILGRISPGELRKIMMRELSDMAFLQKNAKQIWRTACLKILLDKRGERAAILNEINVFAYWGNGNLFSFKIRQAAISLLRKLKTALFKTFRR